MKKTIFTVLLFTLCTSILAQKAKNPIIRDIYTADPSAHVWADGRLYLYPSHDMDPPRGCDLMDKYHVYSTDDMIHWTDHGQILERSQVEAIMKDDGTPLAQPLEGNGTFMWAPDCAYKNGKYYFYFPTPDRDPWNSTWKIGIAISDNPASGFVLQNYWLKGLPDNGQIDPCIFIDDDGQAYFYYGGGGKPFGGKLKDSMDEIDGTLTQMTGLYDFHEGIWVFKKDGLYYLTYPDNKSGANQLRYATSSNPLGPWSHKGVYLNSTSCDTSHGSVVEYKGQWWAFYHTADLSGKGNLRTVCVDSLFFDEKGGIKVVKQTKDPGEPYNGVLQQITPDNNTLQAEDYNDGVNGIAYWDNTKGNAYLEYRNDWVDINYDRRNRIYYVTSTESKEYINYDFEIKYGGTYTLDFHISTATEGASVNFYLEFDGEKTSNPRRYTLEYGELANLPVLSVPDIKLSKGRHTMTFYPSGNSVFDKVDFILTESDAVKTTLNSRINPSVNDGLIHLTAPSNGLLSLYSMKGESIESRRISSGNNSIDIRNCNPGIYLLCLNTPEQTFRYKIIKK